ncbi:MAG: hypothetical protein AMXMBFR13_31150 [Phycisphaerae bacterium]
MTNLSTEKVTSWTGRLIDVRNLDEFARERLDRGECVPLGQLLARASSWDPSEPVLLMCKSGARSRQAALQLTEAGFTAVHTLEGGIEACKRIGVPVIKGKAPIPLFRQVMVAAGLMLLAGLSLAVFHPAFLLIAWFVALGLVVGGWTGFCPMARLLERMPWNRVLNSPGGTCASVQEQTCCTRG